MMANKPTLKMTRTCTKCGYKGKANLFFKGGWVKPVKRCPKCGEHAFKGGRFIEI